MEITLALDAMGGDHGPVEIVPAALYVLENNPALRLILVGQQDILNHILAQHPQNDRITIQHAAEIVEMDDSPAHALRSKKKSSMRISIEIVKDGKADACVSAGNTGALMAMARYVLKMLPGIDRPAICSTLPGLQGDTFMLDLGANVDSSSEQLFQFAVMGSELASASTGKEFPTIALLNVGSEEIKGNDRVKQAANALVNSHLNYAGFAEGNDIYMGRFDVIVCDGFVGNIALKASEGVAELMSSLAKDEFSKSIYGRLAAVVTLPVLKSIKRKIDPRRYNGASLLGLKGIVVKSHGSADKVSFAHAINAAIVEVNNNIPDRINIELEKLFTNG